MKKTKLEILLTVWNVIGIFSVVGFILFSIFIGGSAFHGYCEGGIYYVGDHGIMKETSKMIYEISFIWGVLFWMFIFLTPIGAFLISRIDEKNKQKKNRLE